MTVPSQADIKKRKDNRDKLAKKITDDGHLKENELVRIVRKAIDNAWMVAAHKLVFLEDRVIPDLDETTRTKWLCKCNICGNMFKLTDLQIDHRKGEFPCTNRDEFLGYILSRLDVGFDDLQVLCADIPSKNHVGCHSIKTFGERYGLTFDEAKTEKQVIAICKAKKDKSFLIERGIIPASNAEKRKQQVREELRKEND